MSDKQIEALAERVESILPRVARRMFMVQVDHPQSELTNVQMRLCSVLLGSCESSITDVAEELGVSASAITQIADRLEKVGIVERLRDADDRRVKLLRLTCAGRDMMEERRSLRVSRTAQALARLSAVDRDRLVESLSVLLDASIAIGRPCGGLGAEGADILQGPADNYSDGAKSGY